jgi:hypothetical protein
MAKDEMTAAEIAPAPSAPYGDLLTITGKYRRRTSRSTHSSENCDAEL